MRFRFILIAALLLIFILVFPGCVQTKCNVAEWQDVSWKLKSYGHTEDLLPVSGNTDITILFNSSDNRIGGFGGCNSYFGSYTINKQTCELTIGDIGSTKKACVDATVMQQEQKYFNLLQAAAKVEVKGGELRITCGSELLVYTLDK